MKTLLTTTAAILMALPVYADGPAPGTSDPTVIAPAEFECNGRIFRHRAQMIRACPFPHDEPEPGERGDWPDRPDPKDDDEPDYPDECGKCDDDPEPTDDGPDDDGPQDDGSDDEGEDEDDI